MKSVVLAVLDGYGVAPAGPGNAIELSKPTVINKLKEKYPSTILYSSGESVGLPYYEVGNTEIGHINIGAGRMVLQSLPRINTSIADGSFYDNTVLQDAIKHVKKNKSKMHLLGLVGQHQVHASTDHLCALLFMCKELGVFDVYIHVITDGRDSPPRAASEFIQNLEDVIKRVEVGTIASVAGRYYALDRDRRWDRIEKAYVCLTQGIGNKAHDWKQVLENSYSEGKSDEFVMPTNIIKDGKPVALVGEGDSVVFYNFRIDRPRELTKAFVLDDFEESANSQSYDTYETKYKRSHLPKSKEVISSFERGEKIKNLFFVTMTEYEEGLPVQVAFPPIQVKQTLGSIFEKSGIRQLRVAETEKERFVTFYFNGLEDREYKNEDRLIVPSKKVATYDLAPEMSAPEICDEVIKAMKEKNHQFILVNFANADMVGHTGNIKSTIKAVKEIDKCMGRISDFVIKNDWTLLITADHGNAEEMINPQTGEVSTEHSGNPVPFIAVGSGLKKPKKEILPGTLADIAPTVLTIMGLPIPKSMTGRDLLSLV